MVSMKLIMAAFYKWILVANDRHMRRPTRLSCSPPDYLFERFSPWSPSGAVCLFPARPARAVTSPCKTQVREENLLVWHNLAIFRVCFFVSFVNNFFIIINVLSYCMYSMLSATKRNIFHVRYEWQAWMRYQNQLAFPQNVTVWKWREGRGHCELWTQTCKFSSKKIKCAHPGKRD